MSLIKLLRIHYTATAVRDQVAQAIQQCEQFTDVASTEVKLIGLGMFHQRSC